MSPTAQAVPATDLDVRREPGKPAVLVVPPVDDLDTGVAWVTAHRAAIRAELLRSGSLMIRGLPVTDTADFARVRDGAGYWDDEG